jgi:hypothetical protein
VHAVARNLHALWAASSIIRVEQNQEGENRRLDGGEGGILTLACSVSPRVFSQMSGTRMNIDDFEEFNCFAGFNCFHSLGHISA